ncbi:MAG: CRTAC1 family protein [Planctomycetes bacterium]|nr:CRTAC1 family protein [Planctomycetota bacterium]
MGTAATIILALLVIALSRQDVEMVPAAGANVQGLTSVLKQSIAAKEVPLRFEDVTQTMGLDFVHMPVTRASLLPEDMGSGVACGDYDGDGFPDIYFVNFAGNVILGAPLDRIAGRSRLYRNVGSTRFEDVTDTSGVGFVGYGMGAAWGDYDNDGDLDLYVTAFGPNALYENLGDGTFIDVTEASGVQDTRFSAGASWADFDRDGDLDLYVTNYVDFVYREEDRLAVERQYATEQPYTLNPSSYPPLPNTLFRNNGDGTFADVANAVGVANPSGRSLSASWVDLDNDGWVDLYVANDVSNNAVYLNRCSGGRLHFEDAGATSLAADYRGAMGIAVADFDDDLDQDLSVTHWIAQENALYRNMTKDALMGDAPNGRLWFMDDADGVGLGQVSLDMVGWATGFCDFDNDGLLDLWIVNGSTIEVADDYTKLQAQSSFLFWNHGDRCFVSVGEHAAPILASRAVRRGGAHLDFDRDGLVDLVVTEHGGRATLLKNTSKPRGHWLRVRLAQTGGNSSALGARVYVTAAGRTQMQELGASSSYLSQDEQVLHFGLGAEMMVDYLRIVWPDGTEEVRTEVGAGQELSLVHAGKYPVRKRGEK